MAMEDVVEVERRADIAILRFNRPGALNALNHALRTGIVAALEELNADAGTRAVVLTGAGKAFCAGIDLKEAIAVTPEQVPEWFGEMRDVYAAIRRMDKPTVAAINGVAAGGGFQMALVCDMRVGQPATRMGQPEINAGIPSVLGAFWMSLHLGMSLNMELSYTGRLMAAEECRAVGLLNRLAGEGGALEAAMQTAGELAAKSPVAYRHTKRQYVAVTQAAFDQAFQAGVEGQQECYAAGEPQARMAAFMQKKQG